MKFYLVLICILTFVPVFSQDEIEKQPEIDSLYKEDQFYLGLTYNILGKLPSGVKQTGFSLGLHGGFIKDMALNKQRNIALGLGIGYSYNSFNQNLGILKDEQGKDNYFILDERYELNYSRNNFYLHMIEMPFEFRWRTSTPSEYKFWRIYTGFKLGYVFSHISNFQGEIGKVRYTDVSGFNDWQYGLTLSVGYNTWNFYAYYALNSIFKDDVKTYLDQNPVEMNAIKLGLIFYIL